MYSKHFHLDVSGQQSLAELLWFYRQGPFQFVGLGPDKMQFVWSSALVRRRESGQVHTLTVHGFNRHVFWVPHVSIEQLSFVDNAKTT